MSGLRERLAEIIRTGVVMGFQDEVTNGDELADAALAAFRQWMDAEGLACVPREATEDMALVAIEGTQQAGYRKPTRTQVTVAHRWMCYAAPDPLGDGP
jgi:hypothetical protein